MVWYRKLPMPGSRARRVREAMEARPNVVRVRTRLRVRKPESAFYTEFSRPIWLSGYKVKTTTTYQIAKLFNVSVATIAKWRAAGVLPVPFMIHERGTVEVPIYLSAQIRCLIIVVNDFVNAGYVSIPWGWVPEHVDMLHQGYAEALDNFHKRAGYKEEAKDKPDKYGVNFID